MKIDGFSLIEVLVAMILVSGFMLVSFQVLQHFNQLEQAVQQEYGELKLVDG